MVTNQTARLKPVHSYWFCPLSLSKSYQFDVIRLPNSGREFALIGCSAKDLVSVPILPEKDPI